MKKSSGKAIGKNSSHSRALKTTPKRFASTDVQLIVILGLVLVVFVCYVNTLGNQFVFDDFYTILTNQQIRRIHWGLFLDLYRPFRDLSYAIDFAIWGERPFGFHLTNVVIHAANVLLVFSLIRTFTKNLVTSTLVALIFAVHPIQTDAVAYISGRRDLLFTFFYLLSFHCYLAYYRERWSARAFVFLALFLIFWAFGVLSKEMAVTLPIIIFVWHYCDSWSETEGPIWQRLLRTAGRAFSREKWLYLSLWLAGLAITWYWVFIRGATNSVTPEGIKWWGGSFYTNLLTVIRVHAWYLKQLIFPTPITQYLGAFDLSETFFEWRLLISLVIVGSLIVAGFVLLSRDRLMAFAVLSYFVFLLPVSQIIPHHELLADHYLYLPMMSFGLFVALATARISHSGIVTKKAPYYFVGVAIVVFAVITIFQNRVWKDERTLWTNNYAAAPSSPRAALNLGNTYQETEPLRAEELFKRALDLNPTPDIKEKIYDRLAVILIQQKKYDEAEFYVNDVLQKEPEDFFANLWSTQIHAGRGECDQARKAFLLAQAAAKKPREIALFEETSRQLEEKCGQ